MAIILNNVRRAASRQFRHKKRRYLKDKINELPTSSKYNNIRYIFGSIKEFKNGHKYKSTLVKDENGDMLTDTQIFE
jgi:hypothetical protein